MVFVLLLLCAYFSWVTLADQHEAGTSGGKQVAQQISNSLKPGARILVVTRGIEEDRLFAATLKQNLPPRFELVGVVEGGPVEARNALQQQVDAVACSEPVARWPVFSNAGVRVIAPESFRWPNFLKRENLLNIANQIAVIAIVAIGMTMVIITRGIDLSVGSLLALS